MRYVKVCVSFSRFDTPRSDSLKVILGHQILWPNWGRMHQQTTYTLEWDNVTKRENPSKSVLAATHLIVLV